MDQKLIATWLRPFLRKDLSASQLEKVTIYVAVLLKWNARINLTAIRSEQEIVTRHFGESFFLAQCLFAHDQESTQEEIERPVEWPGSERVLDIGSGAGFPGLPLKIWTDGLQLTLVEANHKKSTFLREVVRTLALRDVSVVAERAETLAGHSDFQRADVVTMRAVERFAQIAPVALTLLAPNGRLALLIGRDQIRSLPENAGVIWEPPISVPESDSRVVVIGRKSKSGTFDAISLGDD
jgi:16S rRNA (guanine527-N7)-methyltransferase